MENKKWNPIYIQRGRFRNFPYLWKKGIDILIEFDYMGSSEFEFGALPNSLRTIRDIIIHYQFDELIYNNKKIIVFFNKNVYSIQELNLTFLRLIQNNIYLQEYSDFDCFIENKQHYTKTNFWWDISNHIMFWDSEKVINMDLINLIKGEKDSSLSKFKSNFHKHDFETITSFGTSDPNAEDFNKTLIIRECKNPNCQKREFALVSN